MTLPAPFVVTTNDFSNHSAVSVSVPCPVLFWHEEQPAHFCFSRKQKPQTQNTETSRLRCVSVFLLFMHLVQWSSLSGSVADCTLTSGRLLRTGAPWSRNKSIQRGRKQAAHSLRRQHSHVCVCRVNRACEKGRMWQVAGGFVKCSDVTVHFKSTIRLAI